MGYYFRGILTLIDFLDSFKSKYRNLNAIHLYKDLVAIPLPDDLFDEININQDIPIKNYEYLTDSIRRFCSEISKNSRTAYIEAEYFGGIGSQNGIVWDSTHIIFEETLSNNAINKSLEQLGIQKIDDKDEFDTVGLGRYRFIDDWISNEIHL